MSPPNADTSPPSLPPLLPLLPPPLPALPPTAAGSLAARPPSPASPSASAAASPLCLAATRGGRRRAVGLPPGKRRHIEAACRAAASVARQKEDADLNDAHLVPEEEERKEGVRGRRAQCGHGPLVWGFVSRKNFIFKN